MVSFEHVRKLMGWCPNANALTRRKAVQFDNLTVNAPGSGGELTRTTAGWWNKYRNRVLVQSQQFPLWLKTHAAKGPFIMIFVNIIRSVD